MDREKVIKGLECCIRHGENAEVGCGRKDECPYEKNGLKCWLDLNRDAIALLKEQEDEIAKFCGEVARLTAMLKEQEAVEPTIDEYGNKRCGSCGHKLQSIADPDMFCCKCGKPILWEGR